MPEFVNNLEKVMYLTKEADVILHGHARGTDDISLMDKLLQGAKEMQKEKQKMTNHINGSAESISSISLTKTAA